MPVEAARPARPPAGGRAGVSQDRRRWRGLLGLSVILLATGLLGGAVAAWPTPYHRALAELAELPWPALAPARVEAFRLEIAPSRDRYELRYRTLGGRVAVIRSRARADRSPELAERANPLRLGRLDLGEDIFEDIPPFGAGGARRQTWQAWGAEYTWAELKGDQGGEPLRWGPLLGAAADLADLPTERASPLWYAVLVVGLAGAALCLGAAVALRQRAVCGGARSGR